MSTLPGNPTALKTKVEGLITSANSIQSAIDDLNKFVTTSKSKAVAATQKEVQNAEKSLEAAHGRYKNTGLALREYQAVLADCHKRADAASAREESANRQRNDAQRTVTATKKHLQQLQSSHAPSVNVQNAQNAVQQAMSNERRAAKAATDASTEIAQIAQEVDEAAGRAISKIDTAMAATKDNWLDKISQFINKVGQVLADITKWVTKVLKKVIEEIAKVLAKVIEVLLTITFTILLIAVGFAIFLVTGILLLILGDALPASLLFYLSLANVTGAMILFSCGQKILMGLHNIGCEISTLVTGPANVHYGDNGETTDTINTRPGKEGLIRDKMDLAGRPHPRGDWKEPPGWHEVGPTELRKLGIDPALLEDKRTGFHATLFRDDNGRYVLSYEGTNFGDLTGDVANDIEGAAGISPQVRQAITAATSVKERLMSQGIADGNFSLTGHSLGGELAAAGSIATGTKATTFDAAGLSYSSINEAMKVAKQNGYFTSEVDARARVENYHFTTDILTNTQRSLPLPSAYGKQTEVQGKPIDWLRHPFSSMGHGLDIMKERYDERYGHLYGAQKAQNQDQEVPIYLGGPPLVNPRTVPTGI